MTANGLEVLDKTLQTTHIWLNEISEIMGPDKQRAYHALKAVLHTLRDRLLVNESVHLAQQLPLLIRGIYFDGWKVSEKPKKNRSREKFIECINGQLQGIRPMDPEEACRAVFTVLERHISPGELDNVKQSLPKKIRDLWPEGEEVMDIIPRTSTEKKEDDMSSYDRGYYQGGRHYGRGYGEERFAAGRDYDQDYENYQNYGRDYDEDRYSSGGRDWNQSETYRGGNYPDYGRNYRAGGNYGQSAGMRREYSAGRNRDYGDYSGGYTGSSSDYGRYSSGRDMNRGYAGSDIYGYGSENDDRYNDDRYYETSREGGYGRMTGSRMPYGYGYESDTRRSGRY